MQEQSADLDILVAQLVKHLADPKLDSNVALLVGHHPDPVKVCEAAVRVLVQTPGRILRCCTMAAFSILSHRLGVHALSVTRSPW